MGETLQLVTESVMPMVIAGFKYSIPMMLISFFLGLLLALLVALGRMSRFKPLSALCAFYVWIIRGTPLLVQLFIIFYGLPSVGIVFSPFVSAIIGLTISQGAYNSEVIRGALTGIPKGTSRGTVCPWNDKISDIDSCDYSSGCINSCSGFR